MLKPVQTQGGVVRFPKVQVLSRHLRVHAKMGPSSFDRFLASDEFKRRFDDVPAAQRRRAVQAINDAEALAQKRDPLPPRVAPPPIGSVARPPRWVDPAAQAQLRAAWAKTGTIEGTARLLRVTDNSARLALKRYVLQPTTSGMQIAA